MGEDRSAKSRSELYSRLEEVLGGGLQYRIHHLSTRPTKSDALFAAPPAQRPQRTHCESHFLTLSITSTSSSSNSASHQTQGGHVFVFAIEVLVYTTATLTTLFVSKADSTGFLSLTPSQTRQSPIRPVTSTFMTWLAETRQRPGVPLVVSLFARAQDQYLFPGSVDHGAKHVLDDRQLVKWWCKTLDPVLRHPTTDDAYTTRAHVIVPGFDYHETTQFFPPSHRSDRVDNRKWRHGHPLLDIAPDPSAPPRCLVPHFPDDPKARYLDELDAEIPDSQPSQTFFSPSKKGNGMWRSIRTLDQFWDTMAFRQECSSGRMVGFIWLVFTPTQPSIHSLENTVTHLTPATSFNADDLLGANLIFSSQESLGQASEVSRSSPRKTSRRKKLSGPIVPRQPKIKSSSSNMSSRSDKTISKEWPEEGRGQIVLEHTSYTRVHDLLLRLDFSNADTATGSTRKWLAEVAAISNPTADWGKEITGSNQLAHPESITKSSQVNDIPGMLVRKKRKNTDDQVQAPAAPEASAVNILSASMIRKKPKVNNNT
ncbi:hypothetical protein E4T47_05868 [Aureobasidium subglaciale]|nr:hypothetical protein E4T47_05868 [Aureobasidium subglaciale]